MGQSVRETCASPCCAGALRSMLGRVRHAEIRRDRAETLQCESARRGLERQMTCQMITRLSLLPGASCPRAPLPRTACKVPRLTGVISTCRLAGWLADSLPAAAELWLLSMLALAAHPVKSLAARRQRQRQPRPRRPHPTGCRWAKPPAQANTDTSALTHSQTVARSSRLRRSSRQHPALC